MDLFRPEAVAAQTDRLHGDIVLARSLHSWVLVTGALIIAAVLLAYLYLGTYTKRTVASGVLLPTAGAVKIVPATGGVIVERRVREGQHVARGDVLFVLADERRLDERNGAEDSRNLADRLSQALAEKREALREERAKTAALARQSVEALTQKIGRLQMESTQLERERALTQERVTSARRMLGKQEELGRAGFISELALQQKKDELVDLEVRLAAVERQQTALQRDIAMSEDELRQLPNRTGTQLASLDRALAGLNQESIEIQVRDRYAVTAPMDGILTAITGEPGQSAGNQPLATLLPAGSELEARLYVPSRAIGFVEVGQAVRLRYQAYPYQKFGQYAGRVIAVARSQLNPNEALPNIPAIVQAPEGQYRITVKLDAQHVIAYGKPQPLVAGMVVEADIVQDTRRLIEWVFEPLFSVTGKLSL